jgi:predicted  nucleic acid-binding Zn-ribbon protein
MQDISDVLYNKIVDKQDEINALNRSLSVLSEKKFSIDFEIEQFESELETLNDELYDLKNQYQAELDLEWEKEQDALWEDHKKECMPL